MRRDQCLALTVEARRACPPFVGQPVDMAITLRTRLCTEHIEPCRQFRDDPLEPHPISFARQTGIRYGRLRAKDKPRSKGGTVAKPITRFWKIGPPVDRSTSRTVPRFDRSGQETTWPALLLLHRKTR